MDTVILHLDDVEKPWVHRVNKATEFVTIERAVHKPINVSQYRADSLPSWEPAFDTELVTFVLDYYDGNLTPHYKQCAGPPNPWSVHIDTSVAANVLEKINEMFANAYSQAKNLEMLKGNSLNVIDS